MGVRAEVWDVGGEFMFSLFSFAAWLCCNGQSPESQNCTAHTESKNLEEILFLTTELEERDT